ncbi:MAG: choice-of-anchor D domain-containing protein, partial [Myxococcales bacterium]|nr:choice-of-anchor D domain-containing protein [Myxococcales bacterium]
KVTPATLNFGTVKLNQSKALVVTIQNVGNATCNFGAPNLSHAVMPGYASDFSITRGPGGPFSVAKRGQPGDQVEIEVTFAPLSVNTHGATLTFHTNDDPDVLATSAMCFLPNYQPPGAGDACIRVSGQSAQVDIEVVPDELDFGVVTVGCNSPEMKITVYNLGVFTIDVENIYLERQDGNFEIRSAPRLPYLAAGGSHFEIWLRYHPQDTNAHRNTLYIQSDASNAELLAVPLYGRGTLISDQTDVFHQATQVKSDVLFVIDNSGSMDWAQNQLTTHFTNFMSWAISQDVDYHIGVIATEVNDPEIDQGTPPREIKPGVLIQAPGRPKIITNQTPDINNAFKDNASIGVCCSGEQEAGLQAAWMALTEPLLSDPTANAGFLRDDAKLYIICISDEQDQSKGEVTFYADFFQNIKGPRNTEMMKLAALVQDATLPCNSQDGSAGTRYMDVARATGGIIDSVCGNWPQALQNLGIQAFTPIREFPLSRPADPNTITVTVNGASVPRATSQGGADGWSYYPDRNSVYFGDDVVPQRGDRIEVHYTAVCL